MPAIDTSKMTHPAIFHPGKFGGKWHVARPITSVAACRGSVEVDRAGGAIHVSPGDVQAHRILCIRCLSKATGQ